MKKALLLFTVVALISTTAVVTSANGNQYQNAQTVAGGVPEEVQASFDAIVTNIMEVNFPGNSGFNANGVAWGKERKEWHATGMIHQSNGSGSVEVQLGRFDNQGDMIEFLYHVNQ